MEKLKETALSKQLETILESSRETISAAGIKGQIIHRPERGYTITLKARAPFSFEKDNVLGTCYPISLAANSAQDVAPLQKGGTLSFVDLSPVGLSSFFAFYLKAELQKEMASISFVLNLPVEGMPADRDKMIMRSIISDKDRFIRYLLFLLSEDPHCGPKEALK